MSIARSCQSLIFFLAAALVCQQTVSHFLFLLEILPLDNVGTRLHGYKVEVCTLGWEKPRQAEKS